MYLNFGREELNDVIHHHKTKGHTMLYFVRFVQRKVYRIQL